MSTRRARIKAVTSLPPRRKNNDSSEKSKRTTASKDELEQILKSPKTPRESLKTQESLGRHSPKNKPVAANKSPRRLNNSAISQSDRLTSPLTNKDATKTPNQSEKVSVITSTSNNQSFVSPISVSSPNKKLTATTANTSLPDSNLKKVGTPLKFIESPKNRIGGNKSLHVDISKKATEINTVITEDRNGVIDDYNVPSVPESVTEDGMDGIVPLQPVVSGPKPIALLKNEIISENAEVLFDPIVPLPSPSKVRPKLRPVPRLNPIRRNSVQGSASESEDENRRALLNGPSTPAPSRQRTESHTSINTLHSLPNKDITRVRNDSVCSGISPLPGQPAANSSLLKERHVIKSRRQDSSRRMTAMRRRREATKSGALTMYDLIFYNPSGNPIIPDQDELKAKEANEKVESIKSATPEIEENADDPAATDAAPVPQIKLGPNGEIILDEQSLVIKTSETRKVSSSVVVEGSWSGINSSRYKRTPRTADWSDAETVRFYRALAALGTDFMLMERLFPGRTRRDLKFKFKKEERMNMSQIDKALRTSSKWDAMKLEEEFKAEREAAERRTKAEAEKIRQKAKEQRERHKLAKELRVRQSKAAKAMETSILPDTEHGTGLTADDFIRRHLNAKEQASSARKRKSKNTHLITSHLVPIAPATVNRTPQFAQLTLINANPEELRPTVNDMATLTKINPPTKTSPHTNIPTSTIPANIEAGSLVVLTVNDPKSPSKKMLQTYITHGEGNLMPVALPPMLLNSVVSYMKKGTPKSTMSDVSSPSSVISQDSRSTTPGVIIPSPAKRQRHSSYTITQL